MFKNYVKIAIRNLLRNKLYSFLNITGLAIGIACCVLILLYVQDELSFDRFHEKADRIFRVNTHFVIPERTMHFATTAHVQGKMFKDEYPEVENYVRFNHYESRTVIRYKENTFYEEKFIFADNTLFDVFSFKLIKGNPKDALVKPNSLVITEEMAEKYFGSDDPLGKDLRVNIDTLFKVTGVMENIPKTSHIRPDFFASFSTLNLEPTGNAAQDMLSNIDYLTYILLREGADYKEFEQKLVGFIDKYIGAVLKGLGGSARLEVQPLTRIYLHSDLDSELERTGDISYVYLFSGIGLFILLLACLNFMNLATARSANRAKEVGLRKVVGAQRFQLIKQFLGESMILTFIALILSLLLVSLTMSIFRNISAKDLTIGIFSNPVLMAGLVALFFIVSIIGGSYPAFFLSAFRPVEVLQGKLKRGAKSSILRIVLVSLQFTVSIVLIIGTLIVQKQLNYIRNSKLGYDKDHVVALRIRNPETQKKYEAIKSELLRHPKILNASASSSLPLGQNDFSAHHAVGKPEDELIMLFGQIVDEDFIDTYKIEMVQGRNFSKEFPTDPEEAIIVNEAAVKKLGWQDNPLNKEIERFTSLTTRKKHRIIGVVKDYHFQSLHEEIQPMILFNAVMYGGNYNRISVRVRPENIRETIGFIESKWAEFDSQYPFEYVFVDDQFDSLYRSEERLGQLFGYFTALAILIGCLGLFGLTSFTAEQRTKEIGIRKVLGASVPSVIMLLVREFTKWVLLAVLIAWPIGYFVMKTWLQNFHYRISLSFDTFLLAALLALIISIITVSYQSIRAALANPADSLKYE
jgi:putative ABC transport system permease protein